MTHTGDTPGWRMTGYPEAQPIYWNPAGPACCRCRAPPSAPPPVGFTGRDGATRRREDYARWERVPRRQHLPAAARRDRDRRTLWCIVGIDIDAYGGKTGAETLAEAERRWGPLPPTYRVTSRDDGVSGIRLYRVPAGTKLHGVLKFPELGIGDIDIIQRHHRYVVGWPPSTTRSADVPVVRRGRRLVVMDTPPGPGDSPELPAAWIEGLRIEQSHNGSEPQQRRGTPHQARVERPQRHRGDDRGPAVAEGRHAAG